MQYHAFLIKYAEIGTKGKNRYMFEDALMKQIRYALKDVEGQFEVTKEAGRIYVNAEGYYEYEDVVEALKRVFGIADICPMVQVEDRDFENIKKQVIAYMDQVYPDKSLTFKVDARRVDKNYPVGSEQMNRDLGEAILEAFPQMKVDVHTPQVRLRVEVRQKVNLFSVVIPGPGGMPVGTNGRATLLLSGGIDSPVAGHMMAKRGLELEAVHFFSYPYTSQEAKQKTLHLAELLAEYCGPVRVQVVPFTKVQDQIRRNCQEDLFTVLMRRFMMRIADRVARRIGAGAVVTGESLGQVASQTMEAMRATGAVTDLPILRPVVGMDKEEIVRIARHIGTFETSILPYEDCCTVFTPRHPRLRPTLAELEAAEAALDIDAMVDAAVDGIQRVKV